MKKIFNILFLLCSLYSFAQQKNISGTTSLQVKTANGILVGEQGNNGVRIFKGIPYAAPPVSNLRWKEPQPVKNWSGVRKATAFGNRAMQKYIYTDMVFRSEKPDEDCLYLNVWTNARLNTDKLPVLIYFHGGGFTAGDGSEPRYDGENMAAKGVVVVTVNYRLGIFGFFAHPELTKESPHHASGNYGLMDQHAALLWVQKNIAAFGGDPSKVTIGGQSAGAGSVNAQMGSALNKNLFRSAIAESGSLMAISFKPSSLKDSEQMGVEFANSIHATSLEDLRKIPAEVLLEKAAASGKYFSPDVDGYFLTDQLTQIFATGLQADIPLLAGWNSAEVSWKKMFGNEALTRSNYENFLKTYYGERADEVLKAYPDSTDSLLLHSATDLASDRYTGYGTWKFIDLHSKTDGYPVYRYLYRQKLPPLLNDTAQNAGHAVGAPHSAEIPYVFGNLKLVGTYQWTEDDFKTSDTMQQYFVNFIKNGDPNSNSLPAWSGLQASIPKVMLLDANAHEEPEKNAKRYHLQDEFYYK